MRLEMGPTEIKFVPKGWGFEKWIVNKEEYCGKLLYFAKGKRCSWHYHELKDETFFIQSGRVVVYYSWDDKLHYGALQESYRPYKISDPNIESVTDFIELGPGDNFHIPRGLRHQVIAFEDTELFEFSTQHFDEDSIRVHKGD